MKNKIIILIILVIALVAILAVTKGNKVAPINTNTDEEFIPLDVPDLIRVSNVKEGDTISSPFTIKGEARGTWFFEATFPISVIDSEGNTAGTGYATAEGEWMTNDFVPFVAKIEFKTGTSTANKQGTLILHKDNPSGLPQFDAALEIPLILK